MKQEIVFDTGKLVKRFCEDNKQYTYFKENKMLTLGKTTKKHGHYWVKFTFPKWIEISPCVAGLIIGEGYIDSRRFAFANSNEKIIKYILKFMSQFGLSPFFVLEVATKNMEANFVEKSKLEWEKIINKKITKIRIREEFNNTTKKGTLHINYYNSCFSKILNIIVKDVKKKVEFKTDLAEDYIKGIIAAEGNINIKSTTTNCLYMVRISAKEEKERDHYKRCLKKIGIKIYCKDMPSLEKYDKRTKHWRTKKGRGGAVLINRWLNFYKILSMDLLDIHIDKKQKFLQHFKYNKTTKWLLEFKNLPKRWFTMRELKDIFELKANPRDRINKMLSLSFIKKRKIKPKNKNPRRVYCLTSKYFKFIDKLIVL